MGRHVAGAGTTPRLGELPPSGRRGAAVGAAGGAPRGRRSPPPGTLAGARGRSGAARASLQRRRALMGRMTPNSREPAVELLQLCPHGLLDLRRHFRESTVDVGHGDRERRDDFLLVVDVPQVHVLHVLEVDLGLPEQLVDLLAGRRLLLLGLVVSLGTRARLERQLRQGGLHLLERLRRLVDQLVHASDLHLLVLRVLILHEHAGVRWALPREQRQVHLHLGLRVHIQARDLLAHGLQPLPQALHLGVELLRRVRDDLDAVVQAHVPLLLHLRQLGELDADVALFQRLLEPLGVSEELLLADLLILEMVEDCLQSSDPVVEFKLVLAGQVQGLRSIRAVDQGEREVLKHWQAIVQEDRG
mmetsp:Transcript_28332/g.75651  ORF Transcript_28332/g.75651 Transcript_28332/m.75651 type:complete len:360 (-) Transcript_28332:852-1931(-)